MTLVTIQLSKQESLNGICDIAKAMEYEWNRAGLKLPHRNTTIQHAQACVRISLCKAISLLRTGLILTLRSSINWQAAMYSSSHEIYIDVSYWLSTQKNNRRSRLSQTAGTVFSDLPYFAMPALKKR